MAVTVAMAMHNKAMDMVCSNMQILMATVRLLELLLTVNKHNMVNSMARLVLLMVPSQLMQLKHMDSFSPFSRSLINHRLEPMW